MHLPSLTPAKNCLVFCVQAVATRLILMLVGLIIMVIGAWNPTECMRRIARARERLAK